VAESEDALLLKRRARRRLVGAVALVLFIVIVLPLVLDREPKPITHDLVVQIPSQEAGRFTTPVLPSAAEARVAQLKPATEPDAIKPNTETQVHSQPPDAKPVEAPSPVKAEREAAEPAKGADKLPMAEAKRAAPASAGQAYVVPLGAFSNTRNAKQVQDKVAVAGYKTYTERVKAGQGEQTRVRAGPFASREAADKAREKLKALGVPVGQVAQR
jgi:DedD protein